LVDIDRGHGPGRGKKKDHEEPSFLDYLDRGHGPGRGKKGGKTKDDVYPGNSGQPDPSLSFGGYIKDIGLKPDTADHPSFLPT
jgi:hypothetical protein